MPIGSGLVSSVWRSFWRHHVFADHAARFADVELVGPVVGVDEFVFGQAPLVDLFLQRRRARAGRGRGTRRSRLV